MTLIARWRRLRSQARKGWTLPQSPTGNSSAGKRAQRAPRRGGAAGRLSLLIGRAADAVKVRGTLVYPSVIEDVLAQRLQQGAEWRIEVDRAQAASDVISHDANDGTECHREPA